MAALLLILPLLLFGCAEDPARSSGTALDGRMFFTLAEKSVILTHSQATYTTLAWWSFEAESLPHADGRYTLRQEMLAASIDELLPPEGQYLYDSWGQYLFDGTTLNLFREGGTYLTPDGTRELDISIGRGVPVVDFGQFVSIDGMVYEQTDAAHLNAIRAAN